MALLPAKTVIKTTANEYWLILGLVWNNIVALTWRLLETMVSKDRYALTLASAETPRHVSWFPLLDWGQVEVVPVEPKSPVGLIAALGRATAVHGVCLLQTADPCSVLAHAARHCFWSLKMVTCPR